MNRRWLKKCAAIFLALLWVFALPMCQLYAHGKHDHAGEESPFWHFVADNRMVIQIVAGFVVVDALALFAIMRLAKSRKKEGPQAAAPGEPPAPK
jgi:hypothetical protein